MPAPTGQGWWGGGASPGFGGARPRHHTRHPSRLDVDHRDEFLHRSGALVEACFFFRGELNFDNLFDSLSSEFYRDADEESVDAIFPVEIGGARKNLFLVFEDGLDHLRDGG